MSGIKNEDFISSNYSPVYRVSLGKWINESIAIQIGYQGRYFNAIADDIKHYYNFYYTEAVFDVKNILFKKKENRTHELLFHLGPGYFYNFEYGRANIHGIIGASIASMFRIVFWNFLMVYFVWKEFNFMSIYLPLFKR